MQHERRQLVIDLDRAVTVRGRVGGTGWLVLEAIASRSPAGQPVVEIRCSTRALAEIVGVSKDSVSRACRVLAEGGIVRRVDHRDQRSGRFSSTSYVVDIAAAGLTVVTVSHTPATVAPATERPRDGSDPLGDQLRLLV
jgi:DNA-binding transcriptional MocR family regulator